ncbi:bifunctional protein HldE [includes: D-beta-D-heptose 7-phosphate kinase; D-beta-D-heptose 1-phosphate adenosyltransferase] [Escherichia coli]|nr:bifunctional protein HldE [includes: D-beta-D-heptose 7-phosphate kinase; D-beta-D-heptose 1-phosphate adenosyltransferase] [Escherichia coli]
MTNGVFDILHAGHVSYLANARKLGDRLIVAVNSDASTKRLKGIPAGKPTRTAYDCAGRTGSGRLGSVV